MIAQSLQRRSKKDQDKANSKIISGRYDKAKKYQDCARLDAKSAEFLLAQSKILDKKINQITSGEIKAGRDFIVQHDYNINPIILPPFIGVSVGRETRIIEKGK